MIKWLVVLSSFLFVGQITFAQAFRLPTNAQNEANLEAKFSVPGTCLNFSTSEDYLATSAGVFATADGTPQVEFSEETNSVIISPDEQWVYANNSLYEITTGELVTKNNPASAVYFSVDGHYIYINYYPHQVDTWEIAEDVPPMLIFQYATTIKDAYTVAHAFELGNGIPRYLSPDQRYWVVANFFDDMATPGTEGGIYDVSTGQRITLPDSISNFRLLNEGYFSPTGRYFFTATNDVYDTTTWDKVYTATELISSYEFYADDQYFTYTNQTGIFATATGDLVFAIDEPATVSADGQWVATTTTVYELATSEIVLETADPVPYGMTFSFSPDGNYALHFADGVYDLRTGEKIIPLTATMRNHKFSTDSPRLYVETSFLEISIYDLTSHEVETMLEGGPFILSPSEGHLVVTQPLPENPQCTVYAVQ